jgi:hypothetical protein
MCHCALSERTLGPPQSARALTMASNNLSMHLGRMGIAERSDTQRIPSLRVMTHMPHTKVLWHVAFYKAGHKL